MSRDIVTVNSLRFDRTVKRSWNCDLVEHVGDRIVLLGEFQVDVEHRDLGLIHTGTRSREYFWLDRWYNVFLFFEPDGNFRNIYCNINVPPTYDSRVLEYVDLDIDIVVWPDRSYEILDQGEFEQNAIQYSYSDEIKARVNSAVEDLSAMAEDERFFRDFYPFTT